MAAPTISLLNPVFGPNIGGQSVVITGTNFSTVTSVSFGGVEVPSFIIGGATSITAITPAGLVNEVAVVVTNPDGAASSPFYFANAAQIPDTTLIGVNPYFDPAAKYAFFAPPFFFGLPASGGSVYMTYDAGTGAIGYGVPTGTGPITLAQNSIFVGDASNEAAAVAMSGDATIVASGALTIANNAITTAKILNANVTLGKLAAGITPSHVIKFGGQYTTSGGAAAEAITVTGAVAATDRAFVQLVNDGPNDVSVLIAVVTTNTLTVTFSGDPGSGAIINYQLIRAAS